MPTKLVMLLLLATLAQYASANLLSGNRAALAEVADQQRHRRCIRPGQPRSPGMSFYVSAIIKNWSLPTKILHFAQRLMTLAT